MLRDLTTTAGPSQQRDDVRTNLDRGHEGRRRVPRALLEAFDALEATLDGARERTGFEPELAAAG